MKYRLWQNFVSTQRLKGLPAQVGIAQNPGEQSGSDDFGSVKWHRRRPAIRVSQAMVAAANSDNHKACSLQSFNDFGGSQPREPAHAAIVTRCTPINSIDPEA